MFIDDPEFKSVIKKFPKVAKKYGLILQFYGGINKRFEVMFSSK